MTSSLAQAIAEDMDAELKIVNMSFENLMLALDKGEVDCVIAALEKKRGAGEGSGFLWAVLCGSASHGPGEAGACPGLSDHGRLLWQEGGRQMSSTNADIVSNDMPGANLVALSSVTDLVKRAGLWEV